MRSPSRLELFWNLSLDMHCLAGPDGYLKELNPAWERTLGFTLEELKGRPFLEFVHPEDRDATASEAARIAAGGSTITFTNRYRCKDGSYRWLRWAATFDPANGLIVALAKDISTQMALQEELNRAHQMLEAQVRSRTAELEEERSFSQALLDSVDVGIVACDAAGTLRLFNRAAREWHGLPAEPLPPERWAERYDLFQADGRTRQAPDDIPLARALRGDHVSGAEMVIAPKGREPRSILASGRSVLLPDGRCLGAVVAMQDVTALKRAERTLAQAAKMEAIGRLAGGVAHDFNNLLTVIAGFAGFLLADLPEGDPRREDVNEIAKAGARAAELTRHLLAFSRQRTVELRPVDLNATLEGIARMLGRLLGEDIAVHLALAPALPRVRADPGQLERIVVNLAVNARDAMPEGGKLILETALADGSARLTVTDTGIGMDRETLSHLFEPYFTTKPEGKGTGLGLATVFAAVREFGGQVSAYSEPGRGSSFKVTLPLAEGEAAPAAPAAPRRAGGSETILLVEDDEHVRRFASRALRQSGYTVLAAQDPAEALRLAAGHAGEVALLLSDVIMPGMPGPKLAEALRAARPGLRVLYMSGYTAEYPLLDEVRKAGAVFLQKPLTLDSLCAKVRAALA